MEGVNMTCVWACVGMRVCACRAHVRVRVRACVGAYKACVAKACPHKRQRKGHHLELVVHHKLEANVGHEAQHVGAVAAVQRLRAPRSLLSLTLGRVEPMEYTGRGRALMLLQGYAHAAAEVPLLCRTQQARPPALVRPRALGIKQAS